VEPKAVENEVKARLAAHDISALEMIWEHYANDLLGYLAGILCSRHDAEDALQDVFTTVARKRAAVARARLLKPYLFRMARNVALNRLRQRGRRLEVYAQAGEDWLEPATPDPRIGQDDRRQLAVALAALPRRQRSVIVLKFFRDKTFREISEMLDISQHTAASRYRYGMARLRDRLREEET
jgi:RNA polymerase sigma-70 factor (ECF subfamily)